jgi:hypothetical protein
MKQNVNDMLYSSPPLWSSGQSSWLQIQRSGFDYRHYQKAENTAVRICRADHVAPSVRKIVTTFTDKQLSLGRYSSFTDLGHGVF